MALAAMQCFNGIHGGATAQTSSDPIQVNLGSFASIGFGGSDTITVNRPEGQGIRSYCAAVGEEHTNKCLSKLQECLNAASGVAPLQLPRDLDSEAQEAISRIDRTRLGFTQGPQGGEASRPVQGGFRSIARDTFTEDKVLYLARMNFLADWSEFLQREGVTMQQQRKVQAALENAQFSFMNAEKRLTFLGVNYLVPDPAKGKEGERLAKLELLRFTQLGGYDRRVEAAQDSLDARIRSTLGFRRAKSFFETVWPGIYLFGLTEPFNPRQDTS